MALFIGALFLLDKGLNWVIALSLSVILHELAHGVMVRSTGMKFNMIFIPFLAAGVIPSDQPKFLALPVYKQASIALAGPLTNAILLVIGIFLLNQPNLASLGNQLVTINLMLIVLNMAPIGPLDGSRISSAILQGMKNWWLKGILSFYFMIVSAISLFFFFADKGQISQTYLIILIVLSVLGVATKLIPSKSQSTPMTDTERALTFTMFFALASLNFICILPVLLHLPLLF